MIHERLPTRAELAVYREKLISLRVLPQKVYKTLEGLPKSAHPLVSMLLYWHHFSRSGERIDVDSVAEHFLTLLHRRRPTLRAALRAPLTRA